MALYTIRLNSLFNIYSTHATTIIAAITTAVAIFIAGILRSIASDIPNISRPLITSTVSTIDGSRNARQNTTSSMNCLKYSIPISNPAVSVARYNCPEHKNSLDATISPSNIIDGIMIQDKVVEILGVKVPCVDEGFGNHTPVDVVIRPEDIEITTPEKGFMEGTITSVIFKGVHYEIEILANGYEWLVHSTGMYPVGTQVGIDVDPFNIQIMHKPASEDEEAVKIDE